MIDGYNIALLELEQKKIPFIIQRPMPNGGSEYWKVSDLEIIEYVCYCEKWCLGKFRFFFLVCGGG